MSDHTPSQCQFDIPADLQPGERVACLICGREWEYRDGRQVAWVDTPTMKGIR